MICDACGIDKTVTVLYATTLIRYHANGRETVERRPRRLCRTCEGGVMTDDEQTEMRIDNQNRRRNA